MSEKKAPTRPARRKPTTPDPAPPPVAPGVFPTAPLPAVSRRKPRPPSGGLVRVRRAPRSRREVDIVPQPVGELTGRELDALEDAAERHRSRGYGGRSPTGRDRGW